MTDKLNQKILIISDTHLTRWFDRHKYQFLKKLIIDADKVIINGDFWDSWFTNFDGFVNSKWKSLFPYLLEKKTVYIYGNHDLQEKCDDRTKLFSVKAVEDYDIKLKNNTYHFEHGRKILESEDDKFLLAYGRLVQVLEKYRIRIIFFIMHMTEAISFKFLGIKMMSTKFAKKRNNILKQSNHNGWLICGDTHCPEIDNKHLFANSGCIMHNYATYLTIENKKISLHTKSINKLY